MRPRPLIAAAVAAGVGAAAALVGALAPDDPSEPARLVAATPAGPVRAEPPTVTAAAPMAHLAELQKIADANGGTRAHGRPGYKATIDMLKGRLDAAGFSTRLVPFTHGGAQSWNLVADWPGGDENDTLMVGAHADSVPAGPGLNDNGSGTAAVLEVALQVAQQQLKPRRHLRFGWWGAEELGLVGSSAYVRGLTPADRSKITSYLNFDMVGTKKVTTWGVYSDGDPGLAGEFKAYFAGRNIPTTAIDTNSRSDHAAFTRAGIRASGVISEDSLSNLDPCYHKACDTQTSLSPDAVALATNMIIAVTWKLAGAQTDAPTPAPTGTPGPAPTTGSPTSTPTAAPSPTPSAGPTPPVAER